MSDNRNKVPLDQRAAPSGNQQPRGGRVAEPHPNSSIFSERENDAIANMKALHLRYEAEAGQEKKQPQKFGLTTRSFDDVLLAVQTANDAAAAAKKAEGGMEQNPDPGRKPLDDPRYSNQNSTDDAKPEKRELPPNLNSTATRSADDDDDDETAALFNMDIPSFALPPDFAAADLEFEEEVSKIIQDELRKLGASDRLFSELDFDTTLNLYPVEPPFTFDD